MRSSGSDSPVVNWKSLTTRSPSTGVGNSAAEAIGISHTRAARATRDMFKMLSHSRVNLRFGTAARIATEPGAFDELPRVMPRQVVPNPLQPPDRIDRPVPERLHEAKADQIQQIAPLVITAIHHLFH